MSDGAQVQERPGAEAEDSPAGALAAAAASRPLPHRGQPGGDLRGKKKKNKKKTKLTSFTH